MKLLLYTFNFQVGRKSKLSDEEVIEEIVRSQSPSMINILYERYADKVYRKCISFVKEASIAEDLTHDIFIKVYMNLSSFKQKSKFSTWLYSITYNFCIDYIRKSKKTKHLALEDSKTAVEDIEVENAEDLYYIQAAQLKVLLEKVKAEEKMILLMKYRDEMSIKDIQAALSISESAVKMRIKRAKEKIRKLHGTLYANS